MVAAVGSGIYEDYQHIAQEWVQIEKNIEQEKKDNENNK